MRHTLRAAFRRSCILAGLMKSYLGLVLGFGLLGGIGMGFGYAAATTAAVRWFGPHERGLVVGLVVGGYGGAAIYISPLAKYLITNHGLSGSFIGLGLLFAVVIIVAGRLLSWPPEGYQPPTPPQTGAKATATRADWTPRQVLARRTKRPATRPGARSPHPNSPCLPAPSFCAARRIRDRSSTW